MLLQAGGCISQVISGILPSGPGRWFWGIRPAGIPSYTQVCRAHYRSVRPPSRHSRASPHLSSGISTINDFFRENLWRALVIFCGATDTPGLDICPGFQSQRGSLTSMLCHMGAMDSSDSPPVWHLLAFWWPVWQSSPFDPITCTIISNVYAEKQSVRKFDTTLRSQLHPSSRVHSTNVTDILDKKTHLEPLLLNNDR